MAQLNRKKLVLTQEENKISQGFFSALHYEEQRLARRHKDIIIEDYWKFKAFSAFTYDNKFSILFISLFELVIWVYNFISLIDFCSKTYQNSYCLHK